MKRVCTLSMIVVTGIVLVLSLTVSAGEEEKSEATKIPKKEPTADHSKFEVLQEKFPDGPSVTKACLSCHTEASKQLMKTSHWTWICHRAKEMMNGQQSKTVGKAQYVINNFCIALASNEPRCTSCHAGFGWKDMTFDFTNENLVDCLVCHDQTGTYKKFPTAAGHPVYEKDFPNGREWPTGSGKIIPPVDLSYVAQNVGPPTRRNCGVCHFFGGGGEGVKHGDMDVKLTSPDRSLDVHMAADDVDFQCTACHTTVNHQVAGRCFELPAYEEREYVLPGIPTNRLACESCHTSNPHPDYPKLNDHADKVACQACHIPTLARAKATKMWWDWSKAGQKDQNGKPIIKKVELKGEQVLSYHTAKGEFIWAKDAVPEYVWFNGSMKHTWVGDKVDDVTPAKDKCLHPHGKFDKLDENKPVVFINRVQTDYHDPKARIWPVKVHRGIQPYDSVNKALVIPKLFPSGPDKDDAFWKSFDWGRSIGAGMKYANLPYSGKFDWIQTEMIWPLKHTVAPKENAVACAECHAPQGRLASLAGFYMPGRNSYAIIDIIGAVLIAGTILATLVHAALRLAFRGREVRK